MRPPTILCTAALLAAAAPAPAQAPLHSNGSPDPAAPALAPSPTTLSGVPAPAGSQWSEVQGPSAGECNAVAGFSGHALTPGAGEEPYRFADDFTVPDGAGWTVGRVAFFAYQSGAAAAPPPFGALTLRIWSGIPGAPGSQVIFGDAATDRLVSVTPTNLYRVLNTAVAPVAEDPGAARLIWRLEADTASLHLAPGAYWLDWQITPIDPDAAAFAPPVTIAGARTTPGANARQLRPADPAARWLPLIDPGKPITAPDLPQDLPFILIGGGACPPDWNHDGLVNSTDISAFLTGWLQSVQGGTLLADFNGDEQVNSSDISAFLTAWLAAVQQGGC